MTRRIKMITIHCAETLEGREWKKERDKENGERLEGPRPLFWDKNNKYASLDPRILTE